MGCVQQKQTQRQHLESTDTNDQSNGSNPKQAIIQESKKEVFKIQLNPIVQRRISPSRRKQSDF